MMRKLRPHFEWEHHSNLGRIVSYFIRLNQEREGSTECLTIGGASGGNEYFVLLGCQPEQTKIQETAMDRLDFISLQKL